MAPEVAAALGKLAASSAQISGEADQRQLNQRVIEQVAELLDADQVWLVRLDYEPDWLVLRAALGAGAPEAGVRQPSHAGLLGRVMRDGQGCHATTFIRDPLAAVEPAPEDVGSVAAAPLRFQGEMLGALLAARAPGRPPLGATSLLQLQVLADLAAARIGATRQSAALRARAQELGVLAPRWRPEPEQAGDFVLIVKNRKQVIDADEAACRVLDYPRDVLLQRTLPEVIPMPPWADHVDTLGTVREQMLRGLVVTFDTIVRRRDGDLLPVRLQLRGFPVPDGFVTQAVFRDISSEQRAQGKALQIERTRVLEEIGAGLAHQMNSPLAVARGNLELLLEEVHEPNICLLLEPTRDALLRLSAAVDGVQRFARPIVPSAWAVVDLDVLVHEVVEQTRPVWQVAPAAEGRPIDVRVETRPMPKVRVHPTELQDALRELLTNAVHALPTGGTITVRAEEAEDQLVLSVADNGVGMSEEVQQRCIVPFFTTRRPRGNGLGLNRVYHVALRHHGQLEIESTEGQGTCVSIRLPLSAGA